MEFHLVDEDVPAISKELIQKACSQRDIDYHEHQSKQFVFEPENKIAPGNILFRPAVSQASMRVEQFLYQPGVATFYKDTWGVLNSCNNSTAMFEANNIAVPRNFYLTQHSRPVLDYYVEQLGGYPVIVKVLGHSSGIGVMKLDSSESLYSVVDYVTASNQIPVLSAYIPDATHWRCVVVGSDVIAAYINPQDGADFRTYGTTDKNEVFEAVDADLAQIAIGATKALSLEFGGVDILKHISGRCYVLECNFPCYYAHAQEVGDIDVAGKMVDHLSQKALKLLEQFQGSA